MAWEPKVLERGVIINLAAVAAVEPLPSGGAEVTLLTGRVMEITAADYKRLYDGVTWNPFEFMKKGG